VFRPAERLDGRQKPAIRLPVAPFDPFPRRVVVEQAARTELREIEVVQREPETASGRLRFVDRRPVGKPLEADTPLVEIRQRPQDGPPAFLGDRREQLRRCRRGRTGRRSRRS